MWEAWSKELLAVCNWLCAACAERPSTPASTNPKFCRSPRSKASLNVSGKTAGLAWPAATLPVKLPVVIPEAVAGGSLEGKEGACEVGNEAICAGDDAERPARSNTVMPRRFSLRCFLLAKSTIVLSSRHHQFGEKDSLIRCERHCQGSTELPADETWLVVLDVAGNQAALFQISLVVFLSAIKLRSRRDFSDHRATIAP